MCENVQLKIFREEKAKDFDLPKYQTIGSSGMDLQAAIEADAIVLEVGQRVLVPTGIKLQIPIGYEVQIRSRSGLAIKHGVMCLNSPGTIDSDYRGEIGVILINLGQESFKIERGMRIAQAVVAPVSRAFLVEVNDIKELTLTSRDGGGFGSTGI